MFIDIDRQSNISIKKQLYDRLTYMILNKEIAHGEKMPSSRELAKNLKIARNTVIEVYEQLAAELFITTRKGSGTFALCSKRCYLKKQLGNKPRKPVKENTGISLISCIPELYNFPKQSWIQATRKVIHTADTEILGYGDPNGYSPLRQALQKYLNTHKGIRCDEEQIIICGGTKDAVRIIALSLQNEFKSTLTESPGVQFVPEIFKTLGYKIIPLTIDDTGIITSKLKARKRAILYTSAAHQFPLGGTLTIERRYELIDFACRNGSFIIEDDCDSEFRYRGAPVNSLFQLNPEKVLHLGTFSKTICPSLRMGYIVIPKELIPIISRTTSLLGNPPSTINQGIMNKLIRNGDYEKHIYRMTKIYKAKVKTMTESLNKTFIDNIKINGDHSGLHIAVRFKDHKLKSRDLELFKKHGLNVELSNKFSLQDNNPLENRLLMSFSHLTQPEIVTAVYQLQKAYKDIVG